MKKIITAIGNNYLNEKLNQNENYEVFGKDIQYKEGILEFLNEKQDIDILIVSEILNGNINFQDLIKEIQKINKNIEIIVFIEKENKELINFLFERGIYKIFQNNQIDLEELEKVLENENSKSKEELNEEIKKLKQIIEMQKQKNVILEKKGKITAITGSYGSGKSILTCLLCKEFSKIKKKTLVIDFDFSNKSISVLYNKFKTKINYNQISENIIEVSEYESLLSLEKEFINNNIFEEIEELRKKYDQIIIDTSGNFNSDYYGKILEIADDIVFVIVPTICDLKKALNMFEVLIKDFYVPIQKIRLVINKNNNYSVDSLIIKKMFGVSKINGNIKYNEEIESSINGKIRKGLNIDI